MGRRKKKVKRTSLYLNEEFEEINEYQGGKTYLMCPSSSCAGLGPEGGRCTRCGARIRKLTKKEKGRDMINWPGELSSKDSHPGSTATGGFFGGGGGGWKHCSHKGDQVVFEDNGKKLYGATGKDLDEKSGNWGLIIDLAHNVRSTRPFITDLTTKKYADALKKLTVAGAGIKSDLLQLEWPDMGVPAVDEHFWYKLWEMLPEKTVVACMGGHGRTGTCLAALIIASGVDYYTALEHVRKTHCKEAVETLGQEQYLYAIYLRMLSQTAKNLAAKGTSKDEIEDLKKEVEYAKANPPTKFSGYPKYQTPSYGGGTSGGSTSSGDWESGNMRKKAGRVEIKVCMSSDCKTDPENCKVPAHLEWVDHLAFQKGDFENLFH